MMNHGAASSNERCKPALISESYRELNRKLHQSRPDYGTSGKRYVDVAMQLSAVHESKDILDYGCGKRTLEEALGFGIANYDPALVDFAATPDPHDIVMCTDVLEHIEPDLLADVLADLRRVTRKSGFLLIATRPAKKYLEDGRNAHLIQQNAKWWVTRIWDAGFRIRQYADLGHELQVIVE